MAQGRVPSPTFPNTLFNSIKISVCGTTKICKKINHIKDVKNIYFGDWQNFLFQMNSLIFLNPIFFQVFNFFKWPKRYEFRICYLLSRIFYLIELAVLRLWLWVHFENKILRMLENSEKIEMYSEKLTNSFDRKTFDGNMNFVHLSNSCFIFSFINNFLELLLWKINVLIIFLMIDFFLDFYRIGKFSKFSLTRTFGWKCMCRAS